MSGFFFASPLALAVRLDQLAETLLVALIVVVFGLTVFGVAYFLMHLLFPFSIRHEIEQDENPALAVVIGSMIVGLGIIIAAAVKT